MNNWKEFWEQLCGEKKKLWGLIALGLAGVAMLFYSPGDAANREEPDPARTGEQQEQAAEPSSGMAREEKEMARKMESLLEQINGAGKVEVSVRLASSSYSNYAINTDTSKRVTREEDQEGGTRTITENNEKEDLVLIQGPQGSEEPVIEEKTASDIDGVLVIAQGASHPGVKASLFQAVTVAMGVEPHKVMVFPMDKGER